MISSKNVYGDWCVRLVLFRSGTFHRFSGHAYVHKNCKNWQVFGKFHRLYGCSYLPGKGSQYNPCWDINNKLLSKFKGNKI